MLSTCRNIHCAFLTMRRFTHHYFVINPTRCLTMWYVCVMLKITYNLTKKDIKGAFNSPTRVTLPWHTVPQCCLVILLPAWTSAFDTKKYFVICTYCPSSRKSWDGSNEGINPCCTLSKSQVYCTLCTVHSIPQHITLTLSKVYRRNSHLPSLLQHHSDHRCRSGKKETNDV